MKLLWEFDSCHGNVRIDANSELSERNLVWEMCIANLLFFSLAAASSEYNALV